MQLYDPRTNGFSPSTQGIGMHVEIRDPEDKIILSKVREEKRNVAYLAILFYLAQGVDFYIIIT